MDRNILDIANRKLQLDAAVLEGVTMQAAPERTGGRAGAAAETRHMGAILANLLREES